MTKIMEMMMMMVKIVKCGPARGFAAGKNG